MTRVCDRGLPRIRHDLIRVPSAVKSASSAFRFPPTTGIMSPTPPDPVRGRLMPRSLPLLALLAALPARAAEPVDAAFFERKVRPLFAAHCLTCNDAKKQKGGLQLTSRPAALKGGD